MWEQNVIEIEINGKIYQVYYEAKVYMTPSCFGIDRKEPHERGCGRISKLNMYLVDEKAPYSPDACMEAVLREEERTGRELDEQEASDLFRGMFRVKQELISYERDWDIRPTDELGERALEAVLNVLG